MTAVTAHAEDHADTHDGHEGHRGASTRHYLLVALALAIITALEVALSYIDVGAAFLPLLLVLMIVKFVMVVLEFMHLRHDHKLFHYLFWSGFLLAIFVYLGYLATFKFFLQA
jgi:cytochrome c oxidase subunit IV